MKVVYILFRGSFFFLDTENTKDGVWQMRWMNAFGFVALIGLMRIKNINDFQLCMFYLETGYVGYSTM